MTKPYVDSLKDQIAEKLISEAPGTLNSAKDFLDLLEKLIIAVIDQREYDNSPDRWED